jgi:pyridoxine 5-phosphate synthase
VGAAAQAQALGLECHAGHGLTLENVGPVAQISEVVELNIGHSIIGEAIFDGLGASVRAVRAAMDLARVCANPGP